MAPVSLTGSTWSLSMPEGMYDELQTHLFPGDQDEHGAVLVAGIHVLPAGKVRLVARDLFLAQDGVDYVPGKRGYRMLRAQFIQRHIVQCRDEKLVYLAIHNHGGSDRVGFSQDDFDSHERGYPALLDITGGHPVGALVFAPRAVAGDIWLSGGKRVTLDRAEIIGRRRRVLCSGPVHTGPAAGHVYDRQTRLFGERGQAILKNVTVGIVGLGGVGSIVSEYLARLGVGHFVLIDDDRLNPTNIPRVVGSDRRDVWWWMTNPAAPRWLRRLAGRFSALKVKIARRVILQANASADVRTMAANVLDPEVAAALQGCDYIFLAADEMRARLLVNAIVHQFLIPGVQVGSKVSVGPDGDITNVYSVVRPLRPGQNCLWCNQLINPAKLAEEAKTGKERKAQRYVDDKDVVAPSVITLNGVGAAHACNDFLMYVTGLACEDASLAFAQYDSRSRTALLAAPRCDPNCMECSSAGEGRLGHGDSGRRLPVFSG